MPEELRIFCNTCGGERNHELLRFYEQPGTEGELIRWQIVQCAGCNSVSFYEEHWVETEEDWSSIGGDVYPIRTQRKKRPFPGLSATLDDIYSETVTAYNNHMFVLCAAGLRALIEGICADQEITEGPRRNGGGRCTKLECKIEGLREKMKITANHANALHENRILGNEALHELNIPDPETLDAAINLVEIVLENLYSIPHHINNLQNRQRANNPGNAGGVR